jgi:hypothetical protein
VDQAEERVAREYRWYTPGWYDAMSRWASTTVDVWARRASAPGAPPEYEWTYEWLRRRALLYYQGHDRYRVAGNAS